MSEFFQNLSLSHPPGIGEPVPWFVAPTPINPRFVFHTIGGYWGLLSFIGNAKQRDAIPYLNCLRTMNQMMLKKHVASFGVTAQQSDFDLDSIKQSFPGGRVFYDAGSAIARRYGLGREGKTLTDNRWFLIDPELRVYASGGLGETEKLHSIIAGLPVPYLHTAAGPAFAPVLVIPRVLDRGFCQALIDAYENGAPRTSGFMRQIDGKTVRTFDESFKRRSDVQIADESLQSALRVQVTRRIAPMIQKYFQFNVTRIERYIVARYDAEEGGFFRSHRDNTTDGTAHRKFAVTINLNAEDYDGGELKFREFGPTLYKAPTGGAVVFSCSLLHEAMPVTRGTRYATLPFLYDDAGYAVRKENKDSVVVEDPSKREKP